MKNEIGFRFVKILATSFSLWIDFRVPLAAATRRQVGRIPRRREKTKKRKSRLESTCRGERSVRPDEGMEEAAANLKLVLLG